MFDPTLVVVVVGAWVCVVWCGVVGWQCLLPPFSFREVVLSSLSLGFGGASSLPPMGGADSLHH